MKQVLIVLVVVGMLCTSAPAQVPSRFPRTVTATIAAGQSLSGPVNLQGCTVARMVVSPLSSSAALTFQGSQEGGTYREIVDFFNAAITFPATTGNLDVVVNPGDWFARAFLKVRSGTASSAVAQSGGAWITFVCKD